MRFAAAEAWLAEILLLKTNYFGASVLCAGKGASALCCCALVLCVRRRSFALLCSLFRQLNSRSSLLVSIHFVPACHSPPPTVRIRRKLLALCVHFSVPCINRTLREEGELGKHNFCAKHSAHREQGTAQTCKRRHSVKGLPQRRRTMKKRAHNKPARHNESNDSFGAKTCFQAPRPQRAH